MYRVSQNAVPSYIKTMFNYNVHRKVGDTIGSFLDTVGNFQDGDRFGDRKVGGYILTLIWSFSPF